MLLSIPTSPQNFNNCRKRRSKIASHGHKVLPSSVLSPIQHQLNMGLKRSRSASLSSSSDSESPFSRKTSADIKIVHLDAATVASRPAVMNCSLPPHAPLNFTSLEDYQVHYQKAHVNRCLECQRNFPDSHYLSLHITENHDPISAAKRDRGEKIYQCLVSTCDRPCSTPAKRRLH